MRLAELDPRWTHWHGRTERIGVSFECPVHRGTAAAHRVEVPFRNPLDGGKAVTRNHLWDRTGETFDELTLSPSVNYQVYDNGAPRDPACWHGFVRGGEVT